ALSEAEGSPRDIDVARRVRAPQIPNPWPLPYKGRGTRFTRYRLPSPCRRGVGGEVPREVTRRRYLTPWPLPYEGRGTRFARYRLPSPCRRGVGGEVPRE